MGSLVNNLVELRRQARERVDRLESKAKERVGAIETQARQGMERLEAQALAQVNRFEAKARERLQLIQRPLLEHRDRLWSGARERLQRALELPTRSDLDDVRGRIDQLALRVDELVVARSRKAPANASAASTAHASGE